MSAVGLEGDGPFGSGAVEFIVMLTVNRPASASTLALVASVVSTCQAKLS